MSDEHPRAAMEKYFSSRLARFYEVVRQSQIPEKNYAGPCLPYVGREFCKTGNPRILYVGKATNGWYETLDQAIDGKWTANDWLRASEDFILGRVLPFYGCLQPAAAGYYQSSFWRCIYSLTCRVMAAQADLEYQREDHRAQNCFEAIAWTNVFKVGTYTGNPDMAMRDLLFRHLNTLPDEIKILQPHIVIFSTGSTYDDFLSRSLRNVGAAIESRRDRISAVKGLPDVECALRTPHFQACTTEEFDDLCCRIIRSAERGNPNQEVSHGKDMNGGHFPLCPGEEPPPTRTTQPPGGHGVRFIEQRPLGEKTFQWVDVPLIRNEFSIKELADLLLNGVENHPQNDKVLNKLIGAGILPRFTEEEMLKELFRACIFVNPPDPTEIRHKINEWLERAVVRDRKWLACGKYTLAGTVVDLKENKDIEAIKDSEPIRIICLPRWFDDCGRNADMKYYGGPVPRGREGQEKFYGRDGQGGRFPLRLGTLPPGNVA